MFRFRERETQVSLFFKRGTKGGGVCSVSLSCGETPRATVAVLQARLKTETTWVQLRSCTAVAAVFNEERHLYNCAGSLDREAPRVASLNREMAHNGVAPLDRKAPQIAFLRDGTQRRRPFRSKSTSDRFSPRRHTTASPLLNKKHRRHPSLLLSSKRRHLYNGVAPPD